MSARSWFAVVFVALALSPLRARSQTNDDQFREDTILCEEALAHLKTCCPGFDFSKVECSYQNGGCDGSDSLPSYSIGESNCLRAMSCGALESSGLCMQSESPGEPLGVCQ
jgi:hypothetical protein